MFFSPLDTPIYSLGPLEAGVFFRFTRPFDRFAPGPSYLFLAGRRPQGSDRCELLLEDDDLNEERLEFPLSSVAEFLQSVEDFAPKQRRPKAPARPDPDYPLYKVFAAVEAGQMKDAARLLKTTRIRGEDREGYDLTRAGALEFFGDCCRESRPEMALWFYERALDFLHQWGSEATSGGEGFARQMEIKPVVLKRDGLRAQLGQ